MTPLFGQSRNADKKEDGMEGEERREERKAVRGSKDSFVDLPNTIDMSS